MRDLEAILKDHPFFKGLEEAVIREIAGCGQNVVFEAGQFLFREGEEANHFYLIRRGRVVIETYAPSRGAIPIETIGEGEVLGWSWLFPPYRWAFDARALELTRTTALDGKCLREKCERDPAMGFALVKRFSHIIMERLQATRMQLLDLYGKHS